MELVAPAGSVYQAGTLSGNPLAVAAGRAALRLLGEEAYLQLSDTTLPLAEGLREAAGQRPVQVAHTTGLLTVFFSEEPVHDYAGAAACDTDAYGAWCRALLARGVYPPPSQFEAWFPSLAHTPDHVARTIEAAAAAFDEISGVSARGHRCATRAACSPPPSHPDAPADGDGPYALVLAAIREGYLQHYGEGRVVRTDDPDLALLAGDRLYALGLARLADRGDLRAVAELADLISLCASAHAEGEPARAEAAWRHASDRVGAAPSKLPGRLSGDIVRRPSPIGTPVRA